MFKLLSSKRRKVLENNISNKQKLKIIRIIFFVLMIASCVAIFYFSSQNGEKSQAVSAEVIRDIIDVYPETKDESERVKRQLTEELQFTVRKSAHFCIYMVLGFTLMTVLSTFSFSNKKKIFIVIFLGMVYAVSDEIHQIFSVRKDP